MRLLTMRMCGRPGMPTSDATFPQFRERISPAIANVDASASRVCRKDSNIALACASQLMERVSNIFGYIL
jgi:hypothetical protein